MQMNSNSKPSGNDRSLVSEISGRGVNGMPVSPCSHGKVPDIAPVTVNRNNSFTDLKNTGLS